MVIFGLTSAQADLAGPYTADANTLYLFHFDEAAGGFSAAARSLCPAALPSPRPTSASIRRTRRCPIVCVRRKIKAGGVR